MPGNRSLGSLATAALVLAIGVPVYLPVPGFEAVALLALGAAVLAAILVLPAQLSADAVARRPGSSIRLVVALMVLTSLLAWIAGAVAHGPTVASALSLLNWVALGALVVSGQLLLGRLDRATMLLRVWVASYAVASAAILVFLFSRFGVQLITSTNRGPFQTAARAVFPTWPNYFGTALAVAVCYPVAVLLAGRRRAWPWFALPLLLGALLVTFSRTALLAGVGALLGMAVVSGRARRVLLPMLGLLVLLTALGFLLPGVRYQFITSFVPGTSQYAGLLERYAFATEALRLWREHPLFGIGFGRFEQFADVTRIVAAGGIRGAAVGSVHNEYMTTLLKGGMLVAAGFLITLAAFVSVFRRALRSPDPDVRSLGLAALGITAVLLLAGMGAESFRSVSVSGPYWVLAGAISVLVPGRAGPAPLPAGPEPLASQGGAA